MSRGFALLYYAGSQDDLHGGDENRVVAYIRAARPDLTRIDHLILSHPHKDHLQLMPGVSERFQVANILESGRVNKTDGYCHFLKAAMAEPGALYHDAIASHATRSVPFTGSGCNGTVTVRQAAMMTEEPVALGLAASMHFLYRDVHPFRSQRQQRRHPPRSRRQTGSADRRCRGRRARRARNAAQPAQHRSKTNRVLVVGHHGSLTSSRAAFLDAVGASIYAISSGPYPYHRVPLPDAEIVAELAARGQVLRTDREDGFRLDDETRACEMCQRKVGPDADETPGGCDNILVKIERDRPITAGYSALVD